MSPLIMTILALVVLFLITLVFYLCQKNLNRELKERLAQKTEAYKGLQEEFELYRQAESFKHEKEKEVNEKVDYLHSGKLSADDILPKR